MPLQFFPLVDIQPQKCFVEAEWGISDSNRKARFYALTAKGRKELTREESEWRRIAAAIARILGPASTKV